MILCYVLIFSVINSFMTEIVIIYQAYSCIFSALCNPRIFLAIHTLNSGIFKTRGLFKSLWNIDQAYSEPCHMAIWHYLGIFRTLCNACICRKVARSESLNIQNPSINASPHIQNTDIFKTRRIFRTISKI